MLKCESELHLCFTRNLLERRSGELTTSADSNQLPRRYVLSPAAPEDNPSVLLSVVPVDSLDHSLVPQPLDSFVEDNPEVVAVGLVEAGEAGSCYCLQEGQSSVFLPPHYYVLVHPQTSHLPTQPSSSCCVSRRMQ